MINVFSLFLAEINRKPYLSNDFKKIQLNFMKQKTFSLGDSALSLSISSKTLSILIQKTKS